jgi:DNA polymerase-3 subunit gamma/tau
MLKTLEEPPEHVKFVLATTDPQKVPVTVLSRCLQFNLRQIPPAQIRARLAAILESESIAYEPAAMAALAQAARGSLRDALSLLDQAIAHGGGKVSAQSVAAMLGLVGREHLHRIADALAQRDGPALIAEADAMAAHGLAFEQGLQELASLWHRIALAQIVPGAITADDADAREVERLAQCFGPEEVQLYYQIVNQGRADIVLAPDDYAGFTMTLLRMLAFAPETAGTAGEGARTASRSVPPAARGGSLAARAGGRSPSPPAPLPEGEGSSSALSASLEATERVGSADCSGKETGSFNPPSNSEKPPEGFSPPSASGSWTEGEGESGQRTPATHAPQTTLADWPGALGAMKLSGMARQLAQNCELVGESNGVVELRLAEAHKHLLEKGPQERLRGALEQHLGRAIRLRIAVGQPVGMTPAAMDEQERRSKLARAARSLDADPFVRDLVENLGARVVPDSIKPQR